ncbi:cyclase family protein [Helicobacter himalayensis]|uniref:cyclase family protein n=1 Tax=Helicobacter himalayensis TaxID=1591088 RepID=UPI003D701894
MKKLPLIALFLALSFTLTQAKEDKYQTSQIVQALEILQKGKWVDLTHAVNEEIPRFGSFPKLEKETLYTVKNDGFFVYKSSFVTQYGTHIDAPIHFVEGKRSLEQIELKELILPLVVINKEKEVNKNPDFILSKQDILEWEHINGAIPEGSFVAFASGWSKRWDKKDFNNKDSKGVAHTPGWSIEALDYVLNERGAVAIGHETFDTDGSKDVIKNNFFESEKFVLAQDKYQLEILNNLTSLPAKGGIIVIGVPKFAGYPGFPVRAFAIIPQ